MRPQTGKPVSRFEATHSDRWTHTHTRQNWISQVVHQELSPLTIFNVQIGLEQWPKVNFFDEKREKVEGLPKMSNVDETRSQIIRLLLFSGFSA